MRIITAITGVVMVGTAIWCFANTGATFLAIAFIIGIAMIIQGIGGICAYIGVHRQLKKSSWILAEGIATGVLGTIILANQLTIDAMIPIFFGMWIMYSGMLRTIAAVHILKAKERSWVWVFAFGMITIVLGIYSFFNAVVFAFGIITLIGLAFIMQGINVIALAVNMPGKYKIFPKLSENDDEYLDDDENQEESDIFYNSYFNMNE